MFKKISVSLDGVGYNLIKNEKIGYKHFKTLLKII